MLAAALSALVFAATPAELCAKCDEVRGLVDKYPVLAQEIRDTCGRVLALEPEAACAKNARLAIEAADRVLSAEQCADCLGAIARLKTETPMTAATSKRVRDLCGIVPPGAPCADAARNGEALVAEKLHAAAEDLVRQARKHAADGEIYLALQQIQRARAIEEPAGIDFELRVYEKEARAGLEAMVAETLDALERGDRARALELCKEIGEIAAPLGLQEYQWKALLEVMRRSPSNGDRGREDLPEVH